MLFHQNDNIFVGGTQKETQGRMTASFTFHFNCKEKYIMEANGGLSCPKYLLLSSTEVSRSYRLGKTSGNTGRFPFPPAPLNPSSDNIS